MSKKIIISIFSLAAVVTLSLNAFAADNTTPSLYDRVRNTMGIDESSVTVTTDGSTVYLSGKVDTLQEKEYAVSAAENTQGVSKVVDDIEINSRD